MAPAADCPALRIQQATLRYASLHAERRLSRGSGRRTRPAPQRLSSQARTESRDGGRCLPGGPVRSCDARFGHGSHGGTLLTRLYWMVAGSARGRTNMNGMRVTLEKMKAVVETAGRSR